MINHSGVAGAVSIWAIHKPWTITSNQQWCYLPATAMTAVIKCGHWSVSFASLILGSNWLVVAIIISKSLLSSCAYSHFFRTSKGWFPANSWHTSWMMPVTVSFPESEGREQHRIQCSASRTINDQRLHLRSYQGFLPNNKVEKGKDIPFLQSLGLWPIDKH